MKRVRIVWFVAVVAAVGLLFAPWAVPSRAGGDDAGKEASAEVLLETVGLVGGLQLYQTYLNIGFLADGRAEGTYEKKDVEQLLGSVIGPLEKVEVQLGRVKKAVAKKADRDAVEELLKVVALLRRQGKQLQAFWETGKSADGQRYETTRKETWKEISTLLKLEKGSK